MINQGTYLRGFFIVIVVEPVTLKKSLLLQIDLRQKRVHFSVLFISFSHFAYIAFRIIMSSRMPCHMPFLLFTLTTGQIRDKNFETDGLISPEYNSPSLTISV